MSTDPLRPGPTSERDVCLYVAEACEDMLRLVGTPRLRTLRYLLDLTRREAEKLAADPDPTPPRQIGR